VKNIKRIGAIRYSTLRPADYWAERGYDWYVGLWLWESKPLKA